MVSRRWWMVGLGLLCLAGGPGLTRAAWPDYLPKEPPPPDPAAVRRDALALAAKIDQLIAARWAARGVQPTEPADDAELMRRLYLDLAGRIPRVSEVRDFLDDKTTDKRQRLVERLLEGPDYVNHFTNTWRGLMLPESNNEQVRSVVPEFENWLRKQFRDNVSYDRMVRDVITTPVGTNPPPFGRVNQGTAFGFYQANELKAENLAASTSRLFLGVKLECAQCHNHPFARWSRQQFWQYAAFFSGFGMPREDKKDQKEIKIAGTDKVVKARFLDRKKPVWKNGVAARKILADWMTAADNPFFARAAANRMWAHFFGVGVVEPVDDLGGANPPSHPELLDELARQLVAHRFDLKFLARAIVSSRTYQLSSATTRAGQDDPRLFARMPIKGLSPEQLFDSLARATGYREEARNSRMFFFGAPSVRDEFLAKFANQDKRTEVQTSILQALALMNGKFIDDATSVGRSETLDAVTDAPFLDTDGRIETLFLAALSRKPSAQETARFSTYVKRAGAKGEKTALGDVFWALLNSSEFILNH
jgi:hypothetical protein